MAAKTPSAVIIESFGGYTLYKATFADIDDTDTWASSISQVAGQWFSPTDDPTQTTEMVDVAEASGTFTFSCSGTNRTGDLLVLANI